MIILDAEFEGSDGKSHHLRLKEFDASKTAEEIKHALEKLTKLPLFEKKGVGLYKKVKHATLIEKKETLIFDKKAPASMAQLEAEMPKMVEVREIKAETKNVHTMDTIRIPQDLTIIEERPSAGRLIQAIELPGGIDPRSLTESQALALFIACMPAEASLETVEIDDTVTPARIVLTETLPEAAESLPESPPAPAKKPKKKRKRLIDRIRKRE